MEWLTPEMSDLLERAASLPFGLQLLRLASPDCVSTTLGVRVEVVADAQAVLDDARAGRELVEAYEAAARRRRADPHAALPPPWPGAPQPHGPEQLLEEARAHPDGVQVLVDEPLETVAIEFCVHPFVVEAARALAIERGLVAETRDQRL